MSLTRARSTALACCVIASTAVGAADVAVKSQPLSPQHNVDGLITDWETLTTVTKEVAVAAANDTDRIMLAISTSDADVKQRLLAAGLVIYLDVKGKKSEKFGVRVPPAGGAAGRGGRGGTGPGAPPDSFDPDAPPGPGGRGHLPAITYVEVIGPEEHELHIVDLMDRKGFAAARADNQGTLLIEVNIPLRVTEGTPYAPAISGMPKVLGLGLVTPDMPELGRGGGGGRSGGGGGGMPGGRGGMSGGGGGGGMGRGEPGGMPPGGHGPSQGKSLKIWTTVSLVR